MKRLGGGGCWGCYCPKKNAPDYFELTGGEWVKFRSDYSYYETKHWNYYIDDETEINAERSSGDYALKVYTPITDNWQTYKGCIAMTDPGYSICQSIEAQGWTTEDERPEEEN